MRKELDALIEALARTRDLEGSSSATIKQRFDEAQGLYDAFVQSAIKAQRRDEGHPQPPLNEARLRRLRGLLRFELRTPLDFRFAIAAASSVFGVFSNLSDPEQRSAFALALVRESGGAAVLSLVKMLSSDIVAVEPASLLLSSTAELIPDGARHELLRASRGGLLPSAADALLRCTAKVAEGPPLRAGCLDADSIRCDPRPVPIRCLCTLLHVYGNEVGEQLHLLPSVIPGLMAAAAIPEPMIYQKAVDAFAMAMANSGSLAPRLQCFRSEAQAFIRGLTASAERQLASVEAGSARLIDLFRLSGHGHAVCQALLFPLCIQPKLLASRVSAVWAAATPSLVDVLGKLSGVIRGGLAGGAVCDPHHRRGLEDALEFVSQAVDSLGTFAYWREESLRLCGEAGTLKPNVDDCVGSSGGGSGGSGGGTAPRALDRRCAGCGKTRADEGVRLRRCRGCGPLTGVMYCGVECAREHWVKGGHRKLCEEGQAALRRWWRQSERLGVLCEFVRPTGDDDDG